MYKKSKIIHILAALLLAVAMLLAFTACRREDSIIGRWELTTWEQIFEDEHSIDDHSGILEFLSDGTGSFVSEHFLLEFEWETDGDQLVMIEFGFREYHTFNISGDTLTLTFNEYFGDFVVTVIETYIRLG